MNPHDHLAVDSHEWASTSELDDWQRRSTLIGEASVPHIEQFFDELPEAVAAIVCTGDGFNLCAAGFDDEAVGRFAALSSSLHSVSGAAIEALPAESGHTPLDVVSIAAGDVQAMFVSFDHPSLGKLILGTAARHVSIGQLLMESRRTAQALRESLSAF